LLGILFTQCGRRAHRKFGAWKFRENRIAHEFYDATFVSLDDVVRQCLKDFDQLQRGAFVVRGTFTVSRDVCKPESDEMMGEGSFWHWRSGDDQVCMAAFAGATRRVSTCRGRFAILSLKTPPCF
jgi:hypothetical protein